ncbi:MAG: outer membrane protein assembly factor BamC [Betaproteobacteria bacterium]|nr:outer membrane protein assembly factor BamC [Betaproteobacteria bacterium]
MRRSPARFCAAIAAAALLGACQSANEVLEGKKVDYKSAGTLPPLEIPPDLTVPTRDDRYALPDSSKGSATLSEFQAGRALAPRPGSTAVLPSVERMRIERTGTQRWLVINQPPEKLWAFVKDFWQENGFLVSLELPEAGVMETDWAENRAKIPQDWIRQALGKLLDQIYSSSERDKFRTRLERGEEGATEIYISHRGMTEVFVDALRQRTMWQARNPDPELEAEFLRRLMVRLGTGEEQAKRQLAVAPQVARAALSKDIGGIETLEVFEPFDRTWRRVGLALDRIGFAVEDRDRQKGEYFVRYADPEAEMAKLDDKRGMLSRLAFWKPSDRKEKTEQYRIHVHQLDGKCVVQVLAKDSAAEGSRSSRRIISLLHEQLK